MARCPSCGFVRSLPGSSAKLAAQTETRELTESPTAASRKRAESRGAAEPTLERPSDAPRRKGTAPASRAAAVAPLERPSEAAAGRPKVDRKAARARRQAEAEKQEREDHSAATSTLGESEAAEPERLVKPLSWLAMRRLRKALSTSGPGNPNLADARRKALQQVAGSNDPRVVPLAVEALKDDWIMVREAAADLLGKFKAEEAVPALIELVSGESAPDLRRVAALALSGMSDTRAVVPLLTLGLEQPQQKLWVMDAISRIGKPAVPLLVGCLKSPDAGLRLDAVTALGRIKSPETVGPLVQIAGDKQSVVRAHIAEALGATGDRRAVPTLIKYLRDPDAGVRANAAAACVRIPDEEVLEPLLQRLEDEDGSVRGFAATALGAIGDPRAANQVARLLRDASEDVRMRAVEALGELADPRTENWVLPLLNDPVTNVRQRVVQVLGKIGTETCIPPLALTVEDFHDRIRKASVEALGRIASPEALPLLVSALRRDRSTEVQLSAIRSLGQLGDPEALPALKEALISGDFALRCRVCAALGEIGTAEAVDMLIPLLQDPAAEIKYHAAVSLGNLGDKRAIKPLEALVSEQDSFVLRGVGRALHSLGDPRGEPLLEQAKQLAAAAQKAAATAARPAEPRGAPAAAPRPSRSPGVRRENPFKVFGTILVSLAEMAKGSFDGMEPGRRMTVLGVMVAVPVLALATWWFTRPSNMSTVDALSKGNVQAVAFCGPATVAKLTTQGWLQFWDREQGDLTYATELPGARGLVGSPDGKSLAVLFQDPKIVFLDERGNVLNTIDGIGTPAIVQFNPAGNRVALAGLDGTILMCGVPDGADRKSVKLAVEPGATSLAVSPDFQHAAYGLADGRVQLFKLETQENYATIPNTHKAAVTAITFALNSPTFATAGANGTTFIWDIAQRKRISAMESGNVSPVAMMVLSPDGRLLARGFQNGVIVVCDLDKLAVAKTKPELSACQSTMETVDFNWSLLSALAFSADGQQVAAGNTDDLDVGVFDVKSGAIVKVLTPLR